MDGHAFVGEAATRGASVALVERPVTLAEGSDIALVQVRDTLVALQELAAWWRGRSAVRMVGITGSTGKTIAKEMVADVLARTRSVLRNEGNLNSETGLPMTLLRLEPEHEVAVLEMSMYTEGEIARLAEIARPEVGVVLAVHPTHLERAGSIEAIARAKSELPAALPRGRAGRAQCRRRASGRHGRGRPPPRSAPTGSDRSADRARRGRIESLGLARHRLHAGGAVGQRRVRSAMPGRHLVPHALAAAAVAEHFAVPLDEVEAALAAGSHADHRMAVLTAASGATLIDDTYNASPVSVSAALDFLAETPARAGRRRYAVLGDMLELGPDEERLHREIGAKAARQCGWPPGSRGAGSLDRRGRPPGRPGSGGHGR